MPRTATLFLAAIMLALPALAAADDTPTETKDQIIKRMKSRFPALLAAKDAGEIGETLQGLVAVVPEATSGVTMTKERAAAVKTLVDQANNDRKAYFNIVARETSTAPEKVAQRFRVRMYTLAKAGHWLQNKKGEWARKPAKRSDDAGDDGSSQAGS